MIAACRAKDLDPDRPKSDQKWCVYSSDKKRLLGRHPTKEKAMKQVAAIEISKKGASECLTCEAPDLLDIFLYSRFIQILSQFFHWEAKGQNFHSDHKMYGDIYERFQEITDSLAERLVHLYESHSYDPTSQSHFVSEMMNEIDNKSNNSMSITLLSELENFSLLIEDVVVSGLPSGLEDLLQGIASDVDKFLYFLRSRTTVA